MSPSFPLEGRASSEETVRSVKELYLPFWSTSLDAQKSGLRR